MGTAVFWLGFQGYRGAYRNPRKSWTVGNHKFNVQFIADNRYRADAELTSMHRSEQQCLSIRNFPLFPSRPLNNGTLINTRSASKCRTLGCGALRGNRCCNKFDLESCRPQHTPFMPIYRLLTPKRSLDCRWRKSSHPTRSFSLLGVLKGPRTQMLWFSGLNTINLIVLALQPYDLDPWTLRGY